MICFSLFLWDTNRKINEMKLNWDGPSSCLHYEILIAGTPNTDIHTCLPLDICKSSSNGWNDKEIRRPSKVIRYLTS